MTQPLFRDDGADGWAAPDAEAEQRALVALSLVPGVGPGRIRALLARFRTASAALRAAPHRLAEASGIGPQTARAIAAFDDHAAVDAQMEAAAKIGAALLTPHDERFPSLLRQIYDPPALLWMRGALTGADARALAIVGTRRCTDYGRRQAQQFATDLVRHGFTVVSGLAYGIDAAAHRAALEAGGRTIAVLGSGVDRIYPARHARLAEDITRQGAVLSEYALGAAPDAPNFPRRNRIVSGLSLGTLIVESHEQGGALITARLAVEQNREVFALPSARGNKAGLGANHLIQRGHAKLVLTIDDILEELNVPAASKVSRETPAAGAAPPEEKTPPLSLAPEEEALLNALGPEPVHIDALCAATGLDASAANVHLLGLEFKGLVQQMAGKQFYRA